MKKLMIAALLLTGVAAQAQAGFDGDTPVEKIAANPDAKAVLDKDIPGLLSDAQYPLFKGMSLKQLQEASNGQLTADTVDKAVADLQALPGATAAAAAAPAQAPATTGAATAP